MDLGTQGNTQCFRNLHNAVTMFCLLSLGHLRNYAHNENFLYRHNGCLRNWRQISLESRVSSSRHATRQLSYLVTSESFLATDEDIPRMLPTVPARNWRNVTDQCKDLGAGFTGVATILRCLNETLMRQVTTMIWGSDIRTASRAFFVSCTVPWNILGHVCRMKMMSVEISQSAISFRRCQRVFCANVSLCWQSNC